MSSVIEPVIEMAVPFAAILARSSPPVEASEQGPA